MCLASFLELLLGCILLLFLFEPCDLLVTGIDTLIELFDLAFDLGNLVPELFLSIDDVVFLLLQLVNLLLDLVALVLASNLLSECAVDILCVLLQCSLEVLQVLEFELNGLETRLEVLFIVSQVRQLDLLLLSFSGVLVLISLHLVQFLLQF